jgi:hypothetical protein
MAVSDETDRADRSPADAFPTKNLPRPEVRDLPAAPVAYRKLIGPGTIAAGVGLASGEFILFPYIASQVGLVFIWAALVGLVTQFFIKRPSRAPATSSNRPRRTSHSGGAGGSSPTSNSSAPSC